MTATDPTRPRRYRKRPVVIEAIQLAVEPAYDDQAGRAAAQAYHDEIAEWINANGGEADAGVNYVEIETLEGDMTARPEDWIIRGVQGEFYPCKPDIFEQTYEPADHTRPTGDQSGPRAPVQGVSGEMTPAMIRAADVVPSSSEPARWAVAHTVLSAALSDVEEIAQLLREHHIDEWVHDAASGLPFRCGCGFEANAGDLDGTPDWFYDHFAAALRASILGGEG